MQALEVTLFLKLDRPSGSSNYTDASGVMGKMLNGINVPNMSHILELEDLRPDHQNLVFIILKTLGFFQFKTKFSSLVFLEPIGCITIVVTTQLVLL